MPPTSTGLVPRPSQSDASGLSGAIKRPASGSKLTKHFNTAQVRAMLAEMKLYLMDGKTDDEIQQLLGVSIQRYNDLKRELYRQEGAGLAQKTAEDVYLEYTWNQQRVMNDLRNLLENKDAMPDNQPNAKVGALKAISEIHDKVLKVGQDVGIISKTPEKKLIIGVQAVANLSNHDLRKLIAQETNALAGALAKYGDKDMDDNPILTEGGGPTFTEQTKTGMRLAGPMKADAARKSRLAVKRAKVIDVEPG